MSGAWEVVIGLEIHTQLATKSKIFSGGEPREFQPSNAFIAEVTGDGAKDLILIAHDRLLIYPQMTEPDGS